MAMNRIGKGRGAAVTLCGLVASLSCLLATRPAEAQVQSADVREFRVGMPLSTLPARGYAELKCIADSKSLAAWGDYQTCNQDAQGLREVGFRYDDDGGHDTKIAGQPVLLSLLFGQNGVVQAIRVRTDPSARLFLRKRGYIFGQQVMARYGDAGWSCTDMKPKADEEPIGGVFLSEHCEKAFGVRHIVMDRALFGTKDKGPNAFVSTTTFVVSLTAVPPG